LPLSFGEPNGLAKKTFDAVLLEAVDETLSTLGDSARQSTYYHLEKKFQMPRRDIPNRPKDFQNGIERIFGSGARFLEILIMKKLYEKLGSPLLYDEKKDLVFADYVTAAKRSMLSK
jgi:hypothetical protein